MIEIDQKIQMTVLLFIFIMGFLYKMKPPSMFESKTGKMKYFGTGPFRTIFRFWLVALCISLLGYVYLSIKEDNFV